MLQDGMTSCPCKRTKCKRHGKCAECIAHHRNSPYPPQCQRKSGKKRGEPKGGKSSARC
ncbi:MAG: hypothetical protein ACOYIR_09490 [Christensenellales bacterium]|jgi:hypothetical protein